MTVAPYKQKKGNGYAFDKRACDICSREFRPKSPANIHCSKRCAYIAVKLSRAAAKSMDRDVAIAFYGSQYDDPLRHIVRGNVRQLIRLIMTFCEENHVELVTRRELELYSGSKLKPSALAVAAKNVSALVLVDRVWRGARIEREVYRFRRADLVTNADAIAKNVGNRRYHER